MLSLSLLLISISAQFTCSIKESQVTVKGLESNRRVGCLVLLNTGTATETKSKQQIVFSLPDSKRANKVAVAAYLDAFTTENSTQLFCSDFFSVLECIESSFDDEPLPTTSPPTQVPTDPVETEKPQTNPFSQWGLKLYAGVLVLTSMGFMIVGLAGTAIWRVSRRKPRVMYQEPEKIEVAAASQIRGGNCSLEMLESPESRSIKREDLPLKMI